MSIITNNKAPLSSSLFMIIRDMPSYLRTAYSLRYEGCKNEGNLFQKIHTVATRYLQLIKEIRSYWPSQKSFDNTVKKLDADFTKINSSLRNEKKPICAYFVSAKDHNGAILGEPVYYYHHHKIKQFQKHYDVAAKVIRNNQEMHEQLKQLKNQFPSREIKVIDIVSHGAPDILDINMPGPAGNVYKIEDVKANEFKNCAEDAVIILDACSCGVGKNSIAEKIAKNNPGKKVMAPGTALFYSKPVFKKCNGETVVNDVVHGFAIVNAYTSKKFRYELSKEQQSQKTTLQDIAASFTAGKQNNILDLLKKLPQYLVHAIYHEVYEIEKNAGRGTDHVDFGKVAFHKQEGRNVSDNVRIQAMLNVADSITS